MISLRLLRGVLLGNFGCLLVDNKDDDDVRTRHGD